MASILRPAKPSEQWWSRTHAFYIGVWDARKENSTHMRLGVSKERYSVGESSNNCSVMPKCVAIGLLLDRILRNRSISEPLFDIDL